MGDRLRQKIASRPDRQELVHRHILEVQYVQIYKIILSWAYLGGGEKWWRKGKTRSKQRMVNILILITFGATLDLARGVLGTGGECIFVDTSPFFFRNFSSC